MRQLATALAALAATAAAAAPPAPSDLTAVPVLEGDYVPARTSWGDPDLRGSWPLQRFAEAGIGFQRPEEADRRVWQTDEEHAARIEAAEQFDARADEEGNLTGGAPGLAEWVRTHRDGRRTSLLIQPENGRLPPLTPSGEE